MNSNFPELEEVLFVYQGCRPWGCQGYHGQILADQLTLSQPGRGNGLCPPNNTCTSGFSDILRPCLLLQFLRKKTSDRFKNHGNSGLKVSDWLF